MNVAQVLAHRVVGLGRLAEVALDEMAEVDRIALGQRLVEAVMLLEGRHRRRVAGRLLAQAGRHGVGRNRLGEEEDD